MRTGSDSWPSDSHCCSRFNRQQGVTLMELMVTIAIVGITLSLALPKGGAGLRVWHQISPEQAVTGPSLIEQTTGLEPTHHAYAVGRMVIHDGHSIHQIAPFVGLGDGDERITLQGHAIFGAQGWLAYF